MSDLGKRIANLAPEKRALLERHLLNKGSSSVLTKVEIRRRRTSDPCILSFCQERLWFLDQLEPGSSAYNIPLTVRLSGHLNVGALEKSIGEILRRHEVLRTTFSTENDQPVQRITPTTTFSLPEVDLSAMPEEQREVKAKQLASEEASLPFDLTAGPLLRATLLRLAPEDHLLLLTMHHIISDGWSMGLLYRELSVLYEAFLQGKSSPLPELPIQYADFALWQKQWLQGERLEKQLTFWREQLREITTLELPTDRPRPSVQTFHGAAHTVQIAKDLTEALQGLSRKEGVTLFMTLLSAFQCLLSRYTGQDDIVVGTPIANRNRAESEGLIGFFVNTLVMRTDTSGDPVFRELLKRVRKDTLDAYTHQDLPFEILIKELHPERDLSRNPLFQVMFALQNVPVSTMELPALTVSRMGMETTRTRFDLEVHLRETAEGLRGALVYNTDLFDSATIERMAGHYQTMLEGIAENADLRLSELPLLTEAERHQLLVEWNNTAAEYPRDKCIHELFEEQVERTPDSTAVIFEDQQLTYRQLNERANQLAHYLRKQGVGPEVLVGICVERSVEMVIGVLGILKAGGAYVPLDPAYPKERLEFMIKDTRTPMILIQRHLLNVLPEHTANVICIDSDLKTIMEESKENPISRVTADNLSYVIYTSGSTGRPKGVSVLHQGVVRLIKETNYVSLTPEEVFLQLASISFDASTFEIWGSLLNGAKLVVMTPGTPSPQELGQAVQKHQITTLWLTAGLFHIMVDEKLEAFKHLRQLLAGGDVLSVSHVRRFLQRHRNCRLINGYGPTENTTFTCCHTIELPGEIEKSVPVGRPVANTRVYVLDGWLQPVPIGVPGELFIGGDGLARGYLNHPELTEEKFILDPFSKEPGARLYKTGDFVRYLTDGSLEFLGRIDHQVKVRGFRIELGEIEAVLAQHSSVVETVVIAREDQRGDKRLVGYVVLKENSTVRNHELRNFLRQKLPDYMVPSVFVSLDSLLRTPSGKVDRRALPAPDHFLSGPVKTFVAPRSTFESQLIRIWEQVLGIQPIGITDNFFELGGHSLLAVQLVSAIKKITKNKFPVMDIFQFPTIEQLAKTIQNEDWSAGTSSLLSIHPGGSKAPLFWVFDTVLVRYTEPDRPLYVLPHPNQNENLALYPTVEKIAVANLREMRSVQPEGPYFIGGYCFWGVVALEMAQQLLRQGEEVALLCMVEPSTKCLPAYVPNIVPLPHDNSFTSRFFRHRRNLSLLRGKEKITYLLRKLSLLFPMIKGKIDNKIIKKIKIVLSRTYLFFGRPLPLPLRNYYLPNIHAREALRKYTPQVYPGRLLIVQTEERSRGGIEIDWNDLATGGVELHEVPGAGHLTILSEPYVKAWAEQLSISLIEVETERKDKKI